MTVMNTGPIATPARAASDRMLCATPFAAIWYVPKSATILLSATFTNWKTPFSIPLKNPLAAIEYFIFFLKTKYRNHHGWECPGNQRRVSDTCNACMQYKHTNEISNDIDDIGRYRQIHGHTVFSHTAKKGSTGVVNRQCRIGIRRNSKVCNASLHHRSFYLTEHQTEHSFISNQNQHCDQYGKNRREW